MPRAYSSRICKRLKLDVWVRPSSWLVMLSYPKFGVIRASKLFTFGVCFSHFSQTQSERGTTAANSGFVSWNQQKFDFLFYCCFRSDFEASSVKVHAAVALLSGRKTAIQTCGMATTPRTQRLDAWTHFDSVTWNRPTSTSTSLPGARFAKGVLLTACSSYSSMGPFEFGHCSTIEPRATTELNYHQQRAISVLLSSVRAANQVGRRPTDLVTLYSSADHDAN